MTYLFKKKLFIIAEIGSNHCGKKKLAFKAIDEAKKSGADAIKFQIFNKYEQISELASTAPFNEKGIDF